MLKEKFFKLAGDLNAARQVNEQDAFLVMFTAQRLRVVKRNVVNHDGVLGSRHFKKSIMTDGELPDEFLLATAIIVQGICSGNYGHCTDPAIRSAPSCLIASRIHLNFHYYTFIIWVYI